MILQIIQRAFDRADFVGGYVGIAHGGQDAFVAQQHLDVPYVGTRFQQMCCETVAQCVNPPLFLNASKSHSIAVNLLNGTIGNGFRFRCAGAIPASQVVTGILKEK